jgi:hypothetical protein
MRKVNDDTFNKYVLQLSDNKQTFIVCRKRNTSSIMIRGRHTVLKKGNGITKKNKEENNTQIIPLIAQVAKNVNQYIVNNNFEVSPVKQIHSSSLTDRDKWREIEVGGKFDYIDIAHCFWQIAHQQNYISKTLYSKTLEKPELKIFRNIALACIVAPKIREYYIKGVKINEIQEDKRLHAIIYNNIRYISYNLMGELAELVGKSFISYRTDGIMVNKKATRIVKRILKEQCFEYRVEECVKVSEFQYKHKGGIKRI